MLVCQNDFVHVRRDGDVIVFEIFDPGAIILYRVDQRAENLTRGNRDRLGLVRHRGGLGGGFVGTVVDAQSIVHC